MGRLKEELSTEHESGEPVVLSIDFDHTICDSDYPACGNEVEGAISAIQRLYELGFGIVINTCRTQEAEAIAIKWLESNGVPYDYVNCNFPYRIQKFGQDCRKISAEVYIDDKNLGGLLPWNIIYQKLVRKYF